MIGPLYEGLLAAAIAWTAAYAILRDRARRRGITIYPFVLVAEFRGASSAADSLIMRLPWLAGLLESSLAVAPLLMAFAVAFLASNARALLAGSGYAAVVPLIPFVTVRSPFLLEVLLLSIPALVIPHELFHALAARKDGIAVRSGGLALVGPIFVGFVEPDEDSMRSSGWRSRAKLAGSGSLANVLIGLALFAALATQPYTYAALPAPLANALYGPTSGLLVVGVAQGYPAQLAGLRPGDVIVSVNGSPINGSWPTLAPGELVVLGVRRGSEMLTIEARPVAVGNRSLLGFYAIGYRQPRLQMPEMGLGEFLALYWAMEISLSVAAFNMLPIYPLDGWLYAESVLEGASVPKRARSAILIAMAAISLALLAANIALTASRYGGLPSL